MSGDGGPDLTGVAQSHRFPGAGVAVPVPQALCAHPGHQRAVHVGGGVEGEVQESGAGDLDPPDPGLTGHPVPEDLGHFPRGQCGGSGQLKGDGAGVVAAAAGPGPLHSHARGHGRAQDVLVHGAAHGVQHGRGEIGGGHGTSVGEGGGLSRTRFAIRSAGGTLRPPGPLPPVEHRRPPALHQLPDEPHQLAGLEGLRQERVDAGRHAVVHLVRRAGADDRQGQMLGPWIGAQPGGRLQPVQPGHDDIECDHVGTDPMHQIQTLDTIGRGHDLEALKLEIDPDQLPDDLVVVDNKHAAARP